MAVGEHGLLIHLALSHVVGANRPDDESVIAPLLQMVVRTVKEKLPIRTPVVPTPVQQQPPQQAHQLLPVSISGGICG